jgi:hypothetical protein
MGWTRAITLLRIVAQVSQGGLVASMIRKEFISSLSRMERNVNIMMVMHAMTRLLWRRKVSNYWTDFWRMCRPFHGGTVLARNSIVVHRKFLVFVSVEAFVTGLVLKTHHIVDRLDATD